MPDSHLHVDLTVRGCLDDVWCDCFAPLRLDVDGGCTRVHGRLPDQSAVHGLMGRIRDAGLPLERLEIRRLPARPAPPRTRFGLGPVPLLGLAAFGLAVAGAPAPTAAQTAGEIAREYGERAAAANPGVETARLAVEVARARADEARARLRPELGLEARYSRAEGGRDLEFPVGDLLNPVYDALNGLVGTPSDPSPFPSIENVREPLIRAREQDTRLRASQLLWAPGASRALRAEEAGIAVEDARLRSESARIRRDAEIAYLRWLNADRGVRILRDALELVRENERVAERRVAAELDTPDRIFRARAERLEVEQRLAEAEAAAHDAEDWLRYLLPESGGEVLHRPDTEEDVDGAAARLLARIGSVDGAAGDRPELALLDAAVDAAEHGLDAARADRLPTLAFAVDAGIQGTGYDVGSEDAFLIGSLVLRWTPFRGGAISARTAARGAELRGLRVDREDAARRIEVEIDRAARALEVARASLEAADAREVDAERAFRLVSRRRDEGLAGPVEFLDARATLTAARLNAAATRDAVRIRMVELAWAAALPPFDAGSDR